MARLIDADALLKVLNKNSIFQKVTNAEGKNVIEIINEQPTVYDVGKVATLIFDLLNEYDIGLWRDIEYVDLAELWVEAIDDGILDDDALKKKIKEFIMRKGGLDG